MAATDLQPVIDELAAATIEISQARIHRSQDAAGMRLEFHRIDHLAKGIDLLSKTRQVEENRVNEPAVGYVC